VDGFTGNPTPVSYVATSTGGVKSSVENPGRIALRYQLPVTTTNTATTTQRETATTTVPTVVPTTVTTTADGVPTTITTTVPTVVPTTATTTETATSTTTAVNNIFTLPNIEHTVREDGPVTFTPKYPSNVDPKSVRFIDGAGKEVNVLEVVGQGKWTVTDNGEVTFTPVDGFTGLPAAVSYIASTRDGVKAVEPAQIQISRHLPVTTTNTTTERETATTTVPTVVPTTVTTAVPTTVTTTADGVPTTITTTVPTVVPTTVRETSTVFMLPDLQRVATKAGQVSFLPDYPAQVKRDTVRFLDGNGGEVNVLVVPGQGRWNV
ncbi:hypothetical protein KIP68_10930, partial [Corynebacterium aquatimens]